MKIKPDPGKHYRIWGSRPMISFYKTPYASRELHPPIPNGSVVVFLGFHPSTHCRAQVLYGEAIGWIIIPRLRDGRRDFWRPVRC